MKKSLFFKLLTAKLFVILWLTLPVQANAGFLDMFRKVTPELETRDTNLQNMALLQAAVSPDPNPSKGGGDVTIIDDALLPEAGPVGTIADIEDKSTGQISIYVVREGDAIGKIAQLFGISTKTIIWANDLPSNGTVKPGQQLIILPISGVRHTIKSGDTIKGIATKYKADIEEIFQFNDLKSDSKLVIGEIITIPDGEIAAPAPSQVKSGVNPWRSQYSGPSYPGYYQRPIAAGRKSQGLHGYNGVDLADALGTPIYAAADGIVIISRTGGWNGGYGNYIVVSHDNGTQTLYAHNLRNFVGVGEKVSRGQMIAQIGTTGKTTGPHVHFEVRGAANPF